MIWNPSVGSRSKDFKMTYFGFSSRPYFLWSILLHRYCGRSIQQVYECEHCLDPKIVWNRPVLQHTPTHLCDSTVSPLNNSILLWSVGSGILSLNPIFSTKFIELFGAEFSTIIIFKRGYLKTLFFLDYCFELLKFFKQLDFTFRKYTHIFLLKSSTNRRKYLAPVIDVVFIGSHRSA